MSGHRLIPSAIVIGLVMTLGLAIAGCGSTGDGGPPRTTAAGIVAGPEATLTAKDFQWSKRTLVVEADDRVLKVVNADSARHSFTAGQLGVDADIEGGTSADIQFEPFGKTGTVAFACKYHPSMAGEIRFVLT